jgi:hypothetical protein
LLLCCRHGESRAIPISPQIELRFHVGRVREMPTRHQRAPMHRLQSPKIRLQYLIFPYADFRVGPLGSLDHFAVGGFRLWKDTPGNWQQYLNCARPSRHLAMYVDREGNPVGSIWIATANDERRVESEEWNHANELF